MTSLAPSQQAAAQLVTRVRELLVSLPAGPVRNDVLAVAVQAERLVQELKDIQAAQEAFPVPVELTGPGIESALSAMNRKYQEGQE